MENENNQKIDNDWLNYLPKDQLDKLKRKAEKQRLKKEINDLKAKLKSISKK
ncbi:MAG: hypothetical protein QXU98_09510 [Candidatus Parvarchaeota archaeon]